MDISDRRVVQFRQWAERKFGIGSGGYAEGEDLLSVVMAAVDARERMYHEMAVDVAKPELDPEFLSFLDRAMGSDK